MKFPKNSFKLLPVILLAVTIGACGLLGEKDRTYTGETKLGFKLPNPAGNIDTVSTISYEVQLIRPDGGVLEQSLPVTFTVVDSTTTAPDASYDIQTPSPVTIPAGSLVTDIVISFDPTAIPSGDAGVLELYIIGNEERGIEGDGNIGHLNLLIEGSG